MSATNIDISGTLKIDNCSIIHTDSSGIVIKDCSLSLNCNSIIDLGSISFCDGTYVGPGSSSFDISTNAPSFKIKVRDTSNAFVVDQSGNILIGTSNSLSHSLIPSYLYFKARNSPNTPSDPSGLGPYICIGGEYVTGNTNYQSVINLLTKGNFDASGSPSLTNSTKGWHIVAKGDAYQGSYLAGQTGNMLSFYFKNEQPHYISGFHIAGRSPSGEVVDYSGAEVGIGHIPIPGVSLYIDPSDNRGGCGAKKLGAIRIGPVGDESTGELQFMEKSSHGTNYVGFKAPPSITTNVVWALPDKDGSPNQVLMTDGSRNLSWEPVGGGGGDGSGNAAIPYEPWNLDITLSELNLIDQTAYCVQFFAPSTATYTNMIVFTTNASTNTYTGTLGVAICSNTPGTPGIPTIGPPLGSGFITFSGGTDPSERYSDIAFSSPIDLSANTKYWAVFGADNTSGSLFMGIHNDYHVLHSVVRQGLGDFIAGTFTIGTTADSEYACWFRIYNENASFSTGPQGAAGAQGDTGATGAQGAQGAQGAAGAQGAQGAAGAQGAQGADGAQGAQGAQGADGAQGAQGAAGAQGAQGLPGSASSAIRISLSNNQTNLTTNYRGIEFDTTPDYTSGGIWTVTQGGQTMGTYITSSASISAFISYGFTIDDTWK